MTGLLGVLLLCSAAGSLAVAAFPLQAEARSALDSGRCEQASGLFLAARQAGDSSYPTLLGLTRSLECMGRMEEALGATYVGANADTSGRVDLLVERILILRRLGLEDVARQTEKEVGVFIARSVNAPNRRGWTWSWIPTVGGSLGWMDQINEPRSAKILNRNDSILLNRRYSITEVPPVIDSISLGGGSVQTAASISWGMGSSSGGIWLGPSGNVALDDDTLGWRSVGGGLDLDGFWNASGDVMVQGGFSGSRTWFATQSGPEPTQDDLALTLVPAWNPGRWSLSLPQTLRTLRTNSGDWTWTGTHAASVSRELLPGAKISVGGSWSWNLDPAGPVDEYLIVRVVEGERLDSTKKLDTSIQLYTGLPPGMTNTSKFLKIGATVNDLQEFQLPYRRNTDWTQAALNGAVTLGPWKSVTFVFSVQWAETDYSRDQEGAEVDRSLAFYDSIPGNGGAIPALLVLRDSTTKNEFLVGSTSSAVSLVPWRYYKLHRRDQCWTTQTTATWRPRRWLNLRAAWIWQRNISNLEDYAAGASFVRNLFSFTGGVSW